jgi:UDP-glucose 4-epimerase
VIPRFITALLEGKQPTIFGDGQQTRDFTFVRNVVHGNLLAADVPPQGVAGKTFNVANGKTTSLLRLLELLNEHLDTEISPVFAEPRVGDVRDSLADISNARKYLGYEPVIDFEDGLRHSLEYYKSLFVAK